MRPHAHRALGPALLAALTAAAWGQQAPKPQPQPYTFSATTRLVQINVVVDSAHGPVAGVQASDFSLTDNGARREVQFFSADAGPMPASPAAATPAVAPVTTAVASLTAPTASFTNALPRSANMVVVLLDALNSADGTDYVAGLPGWSSAQSLAQARQGAIRFLEKLPPGVDVALYALDSQLHVLADFTPNKDRLLAAVRQYKPTPVQHADIGAEANSGNARMDAHDDAASRVRAGQVASIHAEATAPALRAIADHLAGVPGRISLVWIMTRPPFSGSFVEAALGRDNIAVYPMDARGLMTWALQFTADYAHGFSSVAHTTPSGLPQFDDIARQTGGRAFTNTNDFAGAFATAATESEISYTLGFYVPASALDGKFHQIRVHVTGSHLDARYAHGYWATPDAAPRPQSWGKITATLGRALGSPLDDSSVPLTARLTPASPGLLLRATAGIGRMSMATAGGRRRGEIVIETVVQDTAGSTVGFSRHTLNWNWTEAQYRQHLRTGIQFAQMIVPAADGVRLRVLVEDADSAAVGSLTLPLPTH
ncbi:MAG: VWA domain-containing protein [Terriglobales bacterium]